MNTLFLLNSSWHLGKLHQKSIRCSKDLSVTVSSGTTQNSAWFSRFQRSEISIEDGEQWNDPSASITTENQEKVCTILNEDWQSTISKIAVEVNLSYGTCQAILRRDLKIRRISEMLVLRLPTDEQNHRHVFVSETAGWSQKRRIFFLDVRHRRRSLYALLAHGNQTAVNSVENPVRSTSEETDANQVKRQGHDFGPFHCKDVANQ